MSIKNTVIVAGYVASFALFYFVYKGNAPAILASALTVIGSTLVARLIK